MKKIIFAGLLLVVSVVATATDVTEDGSLVELPVEAQSCDLPSAPPPIPEVPEKADLLAAQKNIKQFQADMEVYRACVNEYAGKSDLSMGNEIAISNAHNYSVDMEERVATSFNTAVRAYKANKAKN